MRFHDTEYLRGWKEEGVFPKIHSHIFELFSNTFMAESVVDLCCCTGLLGQHIKEAYGLPVCGIEGEPRWVDRAREWGIEYPILGTIVTTDTLSSVTDWLKENAVDGMVARRCLSELFGNSAMLKMDTKVNWDFAKEFSDAIRDAGVNEIWIEGRAEQGRSVHPVPDTKTEIECLSSAYRVVERYKNCAYLVGK